MNKNRKVGIIGCSNGQPIKNRAKIEGLLQTLKKIGLNPLSSPYIYEENSIFSGSAKQRAEALMEFYKDEEVIAIFDISGGDVANEILPYLDYEWIANSNKQFWGYSDLTVVLNAIYTKTGKSSVLYQIKNIIMDQSNEQVSDFYRTFFKGNDVLFNFSYRFIQGNRLHGIVVGGNIRCLLKLAGTEYWPDMTDKILVLEAYSGNVAKLTTYLCQLQQLGVFDKIKGLILGSFTEMEEGKSSPIVEELIQQYVHASLPIVKTEQLGHGLDSKAIIIGKDILLSKR